MKIAITGGQGHIGSHIISSLIHKGHSIQAIDWESHPSNTHAKMNWYCVDITNFKALTLALEGCDAIIHLAGYNSPYNHNPPDVYANNTIGSYNILHAAATLGISRVCLASSINAIGAAFSRFPIYDYFPIDELHRSRTEDPYSLSKWVAEEQANAFARTHEWMQIASLRFHWVLKDKAIAIDNNNSAGQAAINHLWGYTKTTEACRAIELAITTKFGGHEVFNIVAPTIASNNTAQKLVKAHYPNVPILSPIKDHSSFYNCHKAHEILGWIHQPE